jgi:hypothetical protein
MMLGNRRREGKKKKKRMERKRGGLEASPTKTRWGKREKKGGKKASLTQPFFSLT